MGVDNTTITRMKHARDWIDAAFGDLREFDAAEPRSRRAWGHLTKAHRLISQAIIAIDTDTGGLCPKCGSTMHTCGIPGCWHCDSHACGHLIEPR